MKSHKKKFIKKGMVFLILIILILLTLNTLYINRSINNWEIFRLEKDFNKIKMSNISVLFIGDSHTERVKYNEILKNPYNFAMSGDSFIEIYYRLLYLEVFDYKIDKVVIEIDSHIFYQNPKKTFREGIYYNKFLTVNEISEYSTNSISTVLINCNFPILGVGAKIIRYYEIKNEHDSFKDMNGDFIAKKKVNEHFLSEFSYLEFRYFTKIIELAKKNNSTIVLIQYPLTKEYDFYVSKMNISYSKTKEKIFEELNKSNITYYILDYYDLFFENPEYFQDSDHLNYVGSTIFSKKVVEDLKELNNITFKKRNKNLDSPRPSDILPPLGRYLLT